MAGGVSGYAALNARVRVMYSYLLGAPDLAALSEAADLPSLVSMLKRTAYGPHLDAIKEKELTPRSVVLALKKRLAESSQSIIRTSPLQAHGILAQLNRYFEVSNLKAVLRGIAVGAAREGEGSAWDRIHDLLFPTEAMTILPAQAMVETGNVAAAVELLRGTPYYETLSFALKRYSAEQSLFPLEVALDLYYWRRVWQEARKLMGEDQAQAVRVIGSLVDTNNLMWVIRYRVYQGLSEEELINYTLPFGFRVRDDDVRAVAAGADIAAVLGRLFPGIPNISSYLEEPRTGLPGLELEMKRHVMRQCLAAFVGNPFHIGMPLAYLILHHLEIQDLTVLVEAKASRLPAEKFRAFMLRATAVKA
jgi:V/A-type H+-transporting ATPase subunit C